MGNQNAITVIIPEYDEARKVFGLTKTSEGVYELKTNTDKLVYTGETKDSHAHGQGKLTYDVTMASYKHYIRGYKETHVYEGKFVNGLISDGTSDIVIEGNHKFGFSRTSDKTTFKR